MFFILKEIVICTGNILFDFFCKAYNFFRKHYAGL